MKSISRILVLLVVGLFFHFDFATAQTTKVGVGTTTPQEELDVQGDMNISGAIKPNMQAGTDGQLLQMQANGSMSWVNPSKFENFKCYFGVGATQWFNVPSGVSRIGVELWGGGGRGNIGGGGGSGGYVYFEVDVVTPLTIQFKVGRGGSTFYSPEHTVVYIGSDSIRAYAGGNASTSIPGSAGNSGSTNNPTLYLLYPIYGSHGEVTKMDYMEASAGTFYRIYHYGDGGDSPLRLNTGGTGGHKVEYSNGVLVTQYNPKNGLSPGGGGGGSYLFSLGASGAVIVHW